MTASTHSMGTRQSTRTSVCNAVFMTTKLLEKVLLCLPLKDILLGQRVSKKWQAVIKRSTLIRKALFLLPTGDDKVVLYNHHPLGNRNRHGEGRWIREGDTQAIQQTVTMNPLLRKILSSLPTDDPEKWWKTENSSGDMFICSPRAAGVHIFGVCNDGEAFVLLKKVKTEHGVKRTDVVEALRSFHQKDGVCSTYRSFSYDRFDIVGAKKLGVAQQ